MEMMQKKATGKYCEAAARWNSRQREDWQLQGQKLRFVGHPVNRGAGPLKPSPAPSDDHGGPPQYGVVSALRKASWKICFLSLQ